jgi:hypothetical protein
MEGWPGKNYKVNYQFIVILICFNLGVYTRVATYVQWIEQEVKA